MIKIKGEIDGRDVLVFGLSHANLDRLRAGGLDGGIHIKGEEMGIAFDIPITAGPSERAMIEVFARGIGPQTRVHIDPELKS